MEQSVCRNRHGRFRGQEHVPFRWLEAFSVAPSWDQGGQETSYVK